MFNRMGPRKVFAKRVISWELQPQEVGYIQRKEKQSDRHDAFARDARGGWRHLGEFPSAGEARRAVQESHKRGDFLRQV